MGAIETVDLTMTYGPLTAVDGVSMQVAEGEFVGVLGPNGAGKTTLLEMVEGLRRPTSGSATVLGEPVWPRNAALLPRIGVQLQASSFFERLTAREQIHTFAALYSRPAREADDWLERVGLAEKAGTRVEDLSGGQAQRIALARALLADFPVLILDEPTADVDAEQGESLLRDLLGAATATGRALLLISPAPVPADLVTATVALASPGR